MPCTVLRKTDLTRHDVSARRLSLPGVQLHILDAPLGAGLRRAIAHRGIHTRNGGDDSVLVAGACHHDANAVPAPSSRGS